LAGATAGWSSRVCRTAGQASSGAPHALLPLAPWGDQRSPPKGLGRHEIKSGKKYKPHVNPLIIIPTMP
jgi:hypothetical protein